MSGAVKNDSGKPDLSLLPQVALIRFAEAMQIGEKKYGRYNYCKGMAASRMVGALLRHAVSWFEGEELDSDGQHHLGSVMANCAMLLRQQELGTLTDDRYVAPLVAVTVMQSVSNIDQDIANAVAIAKQAVFVPPDESEEVYEIVVVDNRKQVHSIESHSDPLVAAARLEELKPQWPTFQVKLRVVTTREYSQPA